MRLRVLVFNLVLCACSCVQISAQTAHSNTSLPGHAGRLQGQASDSSSVLRYLKQTGCTPAKIEPGDFHRFAVLTKSSPRCHKHLIVLQVERDSVRPEAIDDISCCKPDVLRWTFLEGLRGRALIVSFNNPIEGAIGTFIYGDTAQGRLWKLYHNGKDSCAPAELRDMDGDGEPELISYHDDPSEGDCDSDCHLAISERFHSPPNWIQVDRWNGRQWVPAGRRDFYQNLASRYRDMDSWFSNDPTAAPCRNIYWMTESTIFRKWADKSDSVAKSLP